VIKVLSSVGLKLEAKTVEGVTDRLSARTNGEL
jgi:hypothetical protein